MLADAGSRTLGQVFDGHVCYRVPDYQRSYIWSDEQADELWNDLMETYENDPDGKNTEYVLGAIVALRKREIMEIVDGQQRLVTLTLMFCAIRDALNEIDMGENIDLRQNIIKKVDRAKSKSDYIRLHSPADDSTLQKIIRGRVATKTNPSKSEQAMIKNYGMFLQRSRTLCGRCGLTNGDGSNGLWKIADIIQDLKDKIYFVYITILDEEQAYQVFQSLNSQGEALNQADLIKSYIVKKSSNKTHVSQRWDTMFKDTKNPDNLIYESVLSRSVGSKDIKKRDLYKKAKKACTNQTQIDTYLENLEKDLEIIKYFEEPESLRSKTKNRNNLIYLFYGLGKINATYFRRPIIAACREWGLDSSKTLALTDCLLKFFFMYRTISNKGIDILRRTARTVTQYIIDNKDLDEILWIILKDETLEQVKNYVNSEDFKNEFDERVFSLKNPIAHYILASMEFYLQPHGSQMRDHLYELQVEHIFPERPNKQNWPNLDDLHGDLHRLGNLTLVTGDWNKAFRNSSFKVKKHGDENERKNQRKSYMNSEVLLSKKYLKEYGRWTRQEIVAREKKLNMLAHMIWDLSNYASRAKKP